VLLLAGGSLDNSASDYEPDLMAPAGHPRARPPHRGPHDQIDYDVTDQRKSERIAVLSAKRNPPAQ
jgi:hypothetical protein